MVANRPCRCRRPASPMPAALSPALAAIRRATHKTIAAVTDDLDKFRFNRAVARIRELTNALEELPVVRARRAARCLREGLETVARLIGPMMPHLAEEMWQTLGGEGLLADQPWPVADPRADARRAGDDRGAGQRQAARHARNAARYGQGRCRERRAGVAAGDSAGSKGSRRARSSSCRTASSTSSREPAASPQR